jgi:hypothetical protein
MKKTRNFDSIFWQHRRSVGGGPQSHQLKKNVSSEVSEMRDDRAKETGELTMAPKTESRSARDFWDSVFGAMVPILVLNLAAVQKVQ